MGKLICLTGTDGSGKTTIARKSMIYLRKHGYYVEIKWIRGTHTIASLISRMFKLFVTFKGPCNPYYNICIPTKMKNLWLWIEFVSIIPVILLKFYLPKMLGAIIIAERNTLDFLIWLIITLDKKDVINSFIGKSILSFTYGLCDKVVYIRADIDVLLDRRKGSPDSSNISEQLFIYDFIAKSLNISVIDTTRISSDKAKRRLLNIIGVGNE